MPVLTTAMPLGLLPWQGPEGSIFALPRRWEKVKMTFQLEALDVFNHAVFQVSGAEGPNVNINSTSFGQTTSQVVGPRNLQARLQIRF